MYAAAGATATHFFRDTLLLDSCPALRNAIWGSLNAINERQPMRDLVDFHPQALALPQDPGVLLAPIPLRRRRTSGIRPV